MHETLRVLAALLVLSLSSVCAQDKSESPLAGWPTEFAEPLASAGVVPVQTIQLSEATFQLSQPYALDETRQIAVAWISIGDRKSVRALYRSNSQCCWRMVDAMSPTHIGKGYHEFDKNVPIDVTVALLQRAGDTGKLTPWNKSGQAQASQEALAEQLLAMLSINRDEGLKSGEVIRVGDMYVSREYASWMPLMPRPFSIVAGRIQTPTGQEVADPDQTKLPGDHQLPDFSTVQASVEFHNPAYARFTRTDGQLTGDVFSSRDGKVRYLFIKDSQQRVFLSCVENLEAPVCDLGLRTQYLDVEGMDAPLIEYGFQIPERFGGKKQNRYQSNWNLVRKLPIIQHYYASQGLSVPAEL